MARKKNRSKWWKKEKQQIFYGSLTVRVVYVYERLIALEKSKKPEKKYKRNEWSKSAQSLLYLRNKKKKIHEIHETRNIMKWVCAS